MMQPPAQLPQDESIMEDGTDGQATQSTQAASQPTNSNDINAHLWGFLQPCSSSLRRIDFWKLSPTVTLGRGPDNDVVFPGAKVSNKHCRLMWDGKEDKQSSVTILDTSSNGTYINGVKIGREKTGILKEGNEIAFGSPQPQTDPLEDYRFIYRHTAAGPPAGGLHAFYDIGHELGKGSFATVMKAVSRSTGQWYAIKMIQENKIRRATAGDPNASNVQRASAFAREISILEKLNHQNICQLKEVFFEDANINLVLEFVDGGDLLDYILKNNGLNEPMSRHITYQIADALAYIHSKGIAHRDLKPENVLLTSHDPPIVKVADFGLAKVVDSLTFLKTMCGTPSYLAPEVVTQQNQEGYDHLVDSWSVGVIVFSMLTTSSPFLEDERQQDIKIRIAERTIDWNTLNQCGISAQAQDFIRCLLDYNPRTRMSLSDARKHPWLKDVHHALPVDQARDIQQMPSVCSLPGDESSILSSVPDDFEDEVMAQDKPVSLVQAVVNQNFEHLQLSQEGGRGRLQRRSHVMSQAAENENGNGNGSGPVIAEPSWQMIASQEAADQNGAGPSTVAGNKRKHMTNSDALTPDGEVRSSPLNDGSNTARKKGKNSSDSDSSPKTRGAAKANRGRGVAAPAPAGATRGRARLRDAAAGMKVQEEHYSDEEEAAPAQKPRRSTRNNSPQKAARK